MATFAPELDKLSKPIEPQNRSNLAQRAKKLSESLQKYYGDKDKIVGASPFSSRLAESEAAAADYKRRSGLLPKMYEQTAKEEEGGAKISQSVEDAYSKFKLASDKIAEQQRQSKVGLGLSQEEAAAGFENKMRELGFTAYKNKADRDDAMEKAYLDGDLMMAMTTAAINSDVKMTDIDSFWQYQINDLNEMWKDYEQGEKLDHAKFIADLSTKAENFANVINGFLGMGKGVVEYNIKAGDSEDATTV